MNLEKLLSFLNDHAGKIVYIRSVPEIFDFTDRSFSGEIQIHSQGGESITVALADISLPVLMSVLKLSVFAADRKLIAWNFKQLCSFVTARTGHLPQVDCAVIDLKVLESYSGNSGGSAPKTFSEAMHRLRRLVESGDYKRSEEVYRNVLLPLMKVVLPRIEAHGIVDSLRSLKVHSYYEIDGQDNGRLKCHDAYKNGFVPHNLANPFLQVLRPLSYDEIFMSFDFKGMEVYTLANLSGDKRLEELCQKSDIYCGIYEAITGSPCEDSAGREMAKKIFLPVIYGQGPTAVSVRCSIAQAQAETLVRKIKSEFVLANEYVMDHERQLSTNGLVRDAFGKVRKNFPQGKDYLARNFAVQAPASTICSEKLINLYFALKEKAQIAYTVHDGYVIYVNRGIWREVHELAHKILTAESSVRKGLRLKVVCKAGHRLNELKTIRKNE